MTDVAIGHGRRFCPLYYPSMDAPAYVRFAGPTGVPTVNARGRFDVLGHLDTWHVGPMSQKFMVAQIRWSELKLWVLYHRIRSKERVAWPKLFCLEARLACSWYFQSDCMDEDAMRLARRVRNEFCLKAPKSREDLVQLARELLSF